MFAEFERLKQKTMNKKQSELMQELLSKIVEKVEQLEEENQELKDKLANTSDIIPCISGSLQELCNWCKKVDFNDAQELIIRTPYDGSIIVDLNSNSSIGEFQEYINER